MRKLANCTNVVFLATMVQFLVRKDIDYCVLTLYNKSIKMNQTK